MLFLHILISLYQSGIADMLSAVMFILGLQSEDEQKSLTKHHYLFNKKRITAPIN